jgi:putative ABC transport system ATP-binding protein
VTPRPVIELDGATVTYPGEVPIRALRPTWLRLAPGELAAVTGRSGSGKSTLLNVLGLLDTPTAGRYELCGHDTSQLTESARTTLRGALIGFVFQACHLLPDRTALENAELGLLHGQIRRRLRRALAEQALESVGLSHRRAALPGTLSGGEKQRVAIARALAQQTQILLCDEPTGNLDQANSDSIVSLLTDLNQAGLTVIIATHDVRIAARCPRLLEIADGVVLDRHPGDLTN